MKHVKLLALMFFLPSYYSFAMQNNIRQQAPVASNGNQRMPGVRQNNHYIGQQPQPSRQMAGKNNTPHPTILASSKR